MGQFYNNLTQIPTRLYNPYRTTRNSKNMPLLSKLSTKEHQGLHLLVKLAKTYKKSQISLAKIGKEENISVKYLEQLILPFKKAGWIYSSRGKNGGYSMKKDPKTISLRDVMLAINSEKETTLAECLLKEGICKRETGCKAKKALAKIQKAIDESLKSIKLNELV